MLEKERLCIAEAYRYKLQDAKDALVNFDVYGRSNLLSALDWKSPILSVFVLVLSPIAYCISLYTKRKKRNELRKMVRKFSTISNAEVPSEKTLVSLWKLHGFGGSAMPEKEQIKIISYWVGILYEIDEGAVISAHERVMSKRRKMSGSLHVNVYFEPLPESLVSDLSDMLEEYG